METEELYVVKDLSLKMKVTPRRVTKIIETLKKKGKLPNTEKIMNQWAISSKEDVELIEKQATGTIGWRSRKKLKVARIDQELFKRSHRLQERELSILENRLFAIKPSSLQEIGSRFGISRERVRQIEESLHAQVEMFLESIGEDEVCSK